METAGTGNIAAKRPRELSLNQSKNPGIIIDDQQFGNRVMKKSGIGSIRIQIKHSAFALIPAIRSESFEVKEYHFVLQKRALTFHD